MKELCEDYETIIEALNALQPQAGQTDPPTEDYQYLSQLKLELEREILQ